MPSKSKVKGGGFERTLAKIFSTTFGGSFIRVPGSGSFIGGINAKRIKDLSETQTRSAKSDIIPPDNMKFLVTEAKNYADIGFHQLIQGSCIQLDGWIEQVMKTKEENDFWIVVFKIDRKGMYIVFDEKLAKQFDLGSFCKYKEYIVADLMPFIETNKDVIIKLSAEGVNVKQNESQDNRT